MKHDADSPYVGFFCHAVAAERPYARRGGRQYRQFSDAVERLSLVRYRNDAFYDPVRAEHRRVSFGFLSYSLPLDPRSCRAWRIAWDPIFFELVKAVGGHLRFDLENYRKLDPASRRLFLFVSKVFARRTTTPTLDLRHLAVNIMGFRSSVATKDLKQKVIRAVVRLEALGIIKGIERRALVAKHARGQFRVVLHRGPYFDRRAVAAAAVQRDDSALHELLYTVGLDEAASARMVRQFPLPLLREWADITLAAKERFGEEFFTRSQQAYFVDNVKSAAQGKRTPPDWWHELRTAERIARRRRGAENGTGAADDISTASRDVLDHVRSALQSAVDDNAAAAVIRLASRRRRRRVKVRNAGMTDVRFHHRHERISTARRRRTEAVLCLCSEGKHGNKLRHDRIGPEFAPEEANQPRLVMSLAPKPAGERNCRRRRLPQGSCASITPEALLFGFPSGLAPSAKGGALKRCSIQ